MFAKYIINTSQIQTQSANTINIPINLEYQIVDNAELVERLFVDTETQKAVNPILDYDKVRFTPVDSNELAIENITYGLSFLDQNNVMTLSTTYADIGFDNDDIKYLRNYFTQSYLKLSFYDSDNAMTQNLVSEVQIYNKLSKTDYYQASTTTAIVGQPKPAAQIPVTAIISNPLTVARALYEGYYIYTYKDNFVVNNPPNYLYMKASYYNAKTGKFISFMTEPTPHKINVFVNKLYTRYDLYRNNTGFYYKMSDTYSQNVTYSQSITNANNKDVTVKLYQVQTL